METRSTAEEKGDQKQMRQISLTSAVATAAFNWNFLGKMLHEEIKRKT